MAVIEPLTFLTALLLTRTHETLLSNGILRCEGALRLSSFSIMSDYQRIGRLA